MIQLYAFGRMFGLPDPSQFVVKGEVLLKMANLPYACVPGDPRKAPKGKLPYIRDGAELVADSTFIRLHLERTRAIDFDEGLSAEQRGQAWAIEKMVEEQGYWMIVRERWMDDANFDRGPRSFFAFIPAPVRGIVVTVIRRKVARDLTSHGLGRHSPAEMEMLVARLVEALAGCLGTKPWLMGDEPCGADASVFAFVVSALCPLFEGPCRKCVSAQPALVAYAHRGMARWYPDLPPLDLRGDAPVN